MTHELLSLWRTVGSTEKIAVALAGVLALYLLLTAFRSPAPPKPRRVGKGDDEGKLWQDGLRTLDSYSKRR